MSNSQEIVEKEDELENIEQPSSLRDDSLERNEHVPISDTEDGEPQKRERKMTDKGKEFVTETRGKARQSAYSSLCKQMKNIRQLIEQNVDLETLEIERDQLDKL